MWPRYFDAPKMLEWSYSLAAASTLALAKRIQAHGRLGRELVIETVRGKRTRHWHYSKALAEVSASLELPEKMTSHRLRHTYATTMPNGGMSLMGVMKLLGHRDYRMTLRYTEITLETAEEVGHRQSRTAKTCGAISRPVEENSPRSPGT